MKAQLIITHPGSTHFDEVTAVGLIMADIGLAKILVVALITSRL